MSKMTQVEIPNIDSQVTRSVQSQVAEKREANPGSRKSTLPPAFLTYLAPTSEHIRYDLRAHAV